MTLFESGSPDATPSGNSSRVSRQPDFAARVGPAALKAREKHGVPALYENFEALAVKQAG